MMDRNHARLALAAALLTAGLAGSPELLAEGHGPVFALATPTLGRGNWSSDTVLMTLDTDRRRAPVSLGQMFGYGIHEDLQVNLKFPVVAFGGGQAGGLNMRAGMMGSPRDVEASLMWRFHRVAPDIGMRRESALHLGLGVPTQDRRRGLKPGPSVNAAVATGFASRSTYWWLAAGLQHQRRDGDDRLGDLYYASAVFGYRPARFRPDGAPLDLRWFIESVAEFPRADRRDGARVAGTGGRRLLAGPSFLALGGPWGLSGGLLLPVYEDLRRAEPGERFRAKLVLTYWF